LSAQAVDRQHVLARQQVHRDRRHALRRIGHRDGAVAHQLDVADRAFVRGQRVVRRDAKTKAISPSGSIATPGRRAVGADADGEVGLAADQRLPGAGQHLGAQAQRVPGPPWPPGPALPCGSSA
jgi:hypothetical protein